MTHDELCRHAALLHAATAVLAWWDDATSGVSEGAEPFAALRIALEEYAWPPAERWRQAEDGEA